MDILLISVLSIVLVLLFLVFVLGGYLKSLTHNLLSATLSNSYDVISINSFPDPQGLYSQYFDNLNAENKNVLDPSREESTGNNKIIYFIMIRVGTEYRIVPFINNRAQTHIPIHVTSENPTGFIVTPDTEAYNNNKQIKFNFLTYQENEMVKDVTISSLLQHVKGIKSMQGYYYKGSGGTNLQIHVFREGVHPTDPNTNTLYSIDDENVEDPQTDNFQRINGNVRNYFTLNGIDVHAILTDNTLASSPNVHDTSLVPFVNSLISQIKV